ncbi:MAG: hypothetical protein AUH85_18475 [Chloroflexi bacterium 13_1_40CM_4_68_4]|nr:MAG: hypothetical protein AUH85_18475 [Chloroflexi bacterium 13_1_40CM_4_68_4]
MFRVLNAMVALVVVAASLLIFSGHAYAHERRTVGPYQIAVGWLNEPAYAGQLNSLELQVIDGRSNKLVFGLEKTLSAEIQAGGLAPFKLELSAADDPNDGYVGWVVPTVTGTYTFRLFGKIDTLAVDEKFTSGPNTFGDVDDLAALQYPTNVPIAADLVKKLDAIQSGVDQTRLIALAALALGLVALGAMALARRRT